MASVIGLGSNALRLMTGRMRTGARTEQTLGDIIETEMVPRLMLAHGNARARFDADQPKLFSDDFLDRFAEELIAREADEILLELESLIKTGAGSESLFLELLAPTARRLGKMWEEDQCDFVEVTMGLWRLQEAMREIASRAPPITRQLRSPQRSLFASMPGDQHSFGTLMIDEVFARNGWESEALVDPERRELLALVSDKPFDLVGLTLTSEATIGPASSLIKAIRSVSANPHSVVFVGGGVVNANPALVDDVGADGTAVDAFSALELAETMVTGLRLTAQPAP